MNISIDVKQTSPDEDLNINDDNALMISTDPFHRIMYREKEDVHVTLDIGSNEMSLIRQGEWVTQGLFSKDEDSYLIIKNEVGMLRFDVAIDQFTRNENSLFIKYRLEDEEGTISNHEYECTWKVEG